ncbi:MAG: 30S ribosome-binding factor RbfA [Coxiella endosymbiont of Haemaphysalis qinghaiensis]
MPSQRQQRVADLIHQQLAQLFKKEVHDPRLTLISLTAVSVSRDLKQAKVFYTLLEDQNPQMVQKALEKATSYLRYLLAEVTALRYVPKLQFTYDELIERADKISLLLKRVMQDTDKKL